MRSILLLLASAIVVAGCNSGSTATTQNGTRGFPTPYAGAFYPMYNSGPNQYIIPTQSMPFNKISAIYISFAHAYPQGDGAILNYESSQPDEVNRLPLIVSTAKAVNPNIKLLITLGWGQSDWDYIDNDYVNHANLFVPSVVSFIRNNQLDGFDIDDEDIGGPSGSISQTNFDGVVNNLRQALNNAGAQDGKTYYLTISPAGNNDESGGIDGTQISQANINNFNLINIQNYYTDGSWGATFTNAIASTGYPFKQVAVGVSSESCTQVVYPSYTGMAGIFDWTMSSDSSCNYENTDLIAQLVNYTGG